MFEVNHSRTVMTGAAMMEVAMAGAAMIGVAMAGAAMMGVLWRELLLEARDSLPLTPSRIQVYSIRSLIVLLATKNAYLARINRIVALSAIIFSL